MFGKVQERAKVKERIAVSGLTRVVFAVHGWKSVRLRYRCDTTANSNVFLESTATIRYSTASHSYENDFIFLETTQLRYSTVLFSTHTKITL